jgi:hypothetical protein
VFKAGDNFGVDSSGILYASNGHFSGTVTATAGTIGGMAIERVAAKAAIGDNLLRNSAMLAIKGYDSNDGGETSGPEY